MDTSVSNHQLWLCGRSTGGNAVDPFAVQACTAGPKASPASRRSPSEVDGELFAIRPDEQGGTDYTWLSGPNNGYGSV
jgi:hypothetical protein